MTNFPAAMNIYPLLLEAVPRERIWGGRRLAQLMHKSLPGDARIGETWEAWPGCRILQGKHAGRTLAALLETDAHAILGHTSARDGSFPLLFKYLDAGDHLSVQVHPNDTQAQVLEGEPFGKTEAWYVLHAEPGSALLHGFDQAISADEFEAALKNGTLIELMSFVTVEAGDVIFLPAGTVHALGKGMVIAEIQQNSDLTYRLYDWERHDAAGNARALHVERGLRVAELGTLHDHKVPSLITPQPYGEQHFLVACRYFTWELLVVRQAARELPLAGTFHILALLVGSASLTFGTSGAKPPDLPATASTTGNSVPSGSDLQNPLAAAAGWSCEVHAGQTVLLPAALGSYGIVPLTPECKLLRMYVPSLLADVIAPLRRAGFEDARIVLLGGTVAAHNDLLPLL